MNEYYTVVIFMAVAVSLIMGVGALSNAMLPNHEKRLFLHLFGACAIGALCEWGGVMLSGLGPEVCLPVTVLKTVEFSLAPGLAVLFAAVMNPQDRAVRIALRVAAAHAVLECVLGPFDVIFSVDQTGTYHHGPAYFIYIATYLASAVFLLSSAKRFTESFQYRNRKTPWLLITFVLACVVVQLVNSEMRVVWLAIAIGSVMFYLFYCSVVQQTDALTRLLNRHSFENTMSVLKSRATVVLLDVDDFKAVNDTYGHTKGDECLQLIGAAINDVFGAHGCCCRVGGDEFCVILTDGRADAAALEEAFSSQLARMRADHPALPSVSIGDSAFDPDRDDAVSAYQKADEVMYARKRCREALA